LIAEYSKYFPFRFHAEVDYVFAKIFVFAAYTILSFYQTLLKVWMTLTYLIPNWEC